MHPPALGAILWAMLITILRVFAGAIWIPALLATNAMLEQMPRQAAIPAILNLWVSTLFMSLVCVSLGELLKRK